DSQQRLWMSDLHAGVFLYDFNSATLRRFYQDSQPALAVNWARAVQEDRDGDFWIATNKGLHRLDPQLQQVNVYTTNQGLSNDSIYGVLEDKTGDIWLSTNDGLNRFDKKHEKFQLFGVEDGLQGREFNTGAFLLGQQQELYFGGTAGFNQLWPEKIIPTAPRYSPLIFTNMYLLNQQIQLGQPYSGFSLDRQMHYVKSLQLTYQQHIFTLDLATLDYLKADQVHYRYRLQGLSEEWLYTRQHSLTFSGLPAGNYLLQVQSSVEPNWNTVQSNQLAISISPPWWQSPYAYLVYMVVLVLLLASLYWLRLKALRRQTVLLQRAVDMRTAELKQALLEKDFVFNHVSHEFRTPLTLIDGAVNELDAVVAAEQSQPLLQSIRYQGRYLLRLVNQLLAGQSLTQPQTSSPSWVDVSALAGSVAADFCMLAQQKNIQLTTAIGKTLTWFGQDEDLVLILNNLLSNAVKYTPAGGLIELQLTTEPSGGLRIQVTDNGAGIAPAEQERIWDYFYRAGNNQSEHLGSGVGLALVKALAAKYQGRVQYRQNPAGGSIFCVSLPMTLAVTDAADALNHVTFPGKNKHDESQHLKTQPTEPQSIETRQTSSQHISTQLELALLNHQQASFRPQVEPPPDHQTILLVEDNLALRQYLVAKLAPFYRCLEADHGLAALVVLDRENPDLIISDLMMPQMDGFALCEQLKGDIATSHIPFILLTASSDQQHKLRGLQHRANLYLAKPFDFAELKLYIENFLLQLSQLKALYQPHVSEPTDQALLQPTTEQQFVQKLQQVLDQRFADSQFQPADLAAALAVSERQLQRKLKALAQVSPALYIRQFRLNQSQLMLRQGQPAGNVAFNCGFSSQAYFTKCFKEAFGETPGQFQK
ncbi:MAG: response regulator, partial [Gammaproteobacteria bacterium]|nr:response regulator [Gammaproteobacteria bacterium]